MTKGTFNGGDAHLRSLNQPHRAARAHSKVSVPSVERATTRLAAEVLEYRLSHCDARGGAFGNDPQAQARRPVQAVAPS